MKNRKAQISVVGLRMNDTNVFLYPINAQNINIHFNELVAEGFDPKNISVAVRVLDDSEYSSTGAYPIWIHREDEANAGFCHKEAIECPADKYHPSDA